MDLIVAFPDPDRRPIQKQKESSPRVNFADISQLYIVQDLTLNHKDDLWFSSQEMDSFKFNVHSMLKKLSSSNMTVRQFAELNIQDTSVFMGLESYLTKDTLQEIGRRRRSVRWAVKLEQQRQRDNGIHDPDALATVSMALTEKAMQRANVVGIMHDDNMST